MVAQASEYYSATKRNAVLTLLQCWMNPEDTMPSETSQTKGHTLCDSINRKHLNR